MSLQVSVIRDDDQNNRDDDDDDEFVAMTADELEEELAEGDAESIEVSLIVNSYVINQVTAVIF